MTLIDFSKKALVIVTGASKGIGRTIAVEVSRLLQQNSILILMARSLEGLESTKSLIGEIDKSITVIVHPIDLAKSDVASYETVFDRSLAEIDNTAIDFAVIFHNAGSTGEIKQTTDLCQIGAWRSYFDLNLFSAATLNSVFIKKIRPLARQLVVVNITSLCGRTPFMNLAMYGAGKAAREIFFKVLALEESKIVVLNYSPGPVDTDMFDNIIDTAQSEDVRTSFRHVKEDSILTPEQTVGKLISLLEKGEFKSGDTIDYYDKI